MTRKVRSDQPSKRNLIPHQSQCVSTAVTQLVIPSRCGTLYWIEKTHEASRGEVTCWDSLHDTRMNILKKVTKRDNHIKDNNAIANLNIENMKQDWFYASSPTFLWINVAWARRLRNIQKKKKSQCNKYPRSTEMNASKSWKPVVEHVISSMSWMCAGSLTICETRAIL